MEIEMKTFDSKAAMYDHMAGILSEMAEETADAAAFLANASAVLKLFLKDVNWAGFYLMRKGALLVGPFQGKPAVPVIAVGKGVCGTAAAERKTQIVGDVHACKNHIACDISSRSEIVVPLIHEEKLLGVIDIDSPQKGRFDEEDGQGLEILAALIAGVLAKE